MGVEWSLSFQMLLRLSWEHSRMGTRHCLVSLAFYLIYIRSFLFSVLLLLFCLLFVCFFARVDCRQRLLLYNKWNIFEMAVPASWYPVFFGNKMAGWYWCPLRKISNFNEKTLLDVKLKKLFSQMLPRMVSSWRFRGVSAWLPDVGMGRVLRPRDENGKRRYICKCLRISLHIEEFMLMVKAFKWVPESESAFNL